MKPTIILLAAGASTRMGQSKQLLKIEGESLLARTADIALQSEAQSVVIVLGANEENHRSAIHDLKVDVITNPDWKSGVGSSLKTGLEYTLKHFPQTEGVIILVCDQPYLTSGHLKELAAQYETSRKPIIASHYSGVVGVPAFFHKQMFPKLRALLADQGAKKIILQHLDETVRVEFLEGAVDLDTPEDYEAFVRGNNK